MIEECGNDVKKMYRVVKHLTNRDGEVILPEGEEDKFVANKFMDLKIKNFDNQGASRELSFIWPNSQL